MSKIGIFTLFQYKVNDNLDKIINKIIANYELTDVKYSGEFIKLHFSNRIVVTAWNLGQYDFWMSHGNITVDGNEFFSWLYGRPKRKTMNKVLKLISKFTDKKLIALSK